MRRSFWSYFGGIGTGLVLFFALAFGFGMISIPSANPNEDESGWAVIAGGSSESGTQAELTLIDNNAPIIAVPVTGDEYRTPDELNNISIYDARNRGVVNITTETVSYNLFFEPVPREGSSGSGSIIDPRGYVLTNNHVISNAVRVFVTLAGGIRYEAEVVGTDRENDLAVLRFDPGDADLTVIPLGSSTNLNVGQKVLAIGNPFSFERTLTTGVISGLGRPIQTQTGTVINDMIQTDASINPGNSGGPLLDNQGNLIGVNTVIYTTSGGSVGVGFAIPVDTARRVIPDLIQFGRVQRGWIDIVPIQLFSQLVSYANLPVREGILISQLTPGGKAEEAGLRGGNSRNAVRSGNTIIYLGGDIITEVAGTAVTSLATLFEALEDSKPGDVVDVVYYRNGRRQETEVELVLRPERYM